MRIVKLGAYAPKPFELKIKCKRCKSRYIIDDPINDLRVGTVTRLESQSTGIGEVSSFTVERDGFIFTCPVCKNQIEIRSTRKERKIRKYIEEVETDKQEM